MTPEDPLWGTGGMLCLALAVALLQDERERRLAAGGLLILGLALAAWRAGSPADAGLIPPGRLGRGFLVGNGGLLLLGSALVCGAALRSPPAPLRLGARLLTAGGIVLIGPVLVAFLGAGGPPRALASALGLGLAGAAIAVGVRAIAARGAVRTATRRLAPPPLDPMVQAAAVDRRLVVLLLAATLAVWLGPHVAAVFAGVVVAAWAGYLAFHPPGRRPVPVAPVLTLLLVPAYLLLATISGPAGLSIAALPAVPLSPAAEQVISPALLLAGWAAAGLWPLQRQLPGAVLAPAGALLLARVAIPLAPGGLAYWQPLVVPLVVLGLWNAAAWGRWPLLLAGAGLLGIAGGTAEDVPAAAGLLAVGLALELWSKASVSAWWMTLVRAVSWPLVTWIGIRVLEGLLRGEVVYSAVAVLGLALIVAARRASAVADASRAR